MRQFCVNSASNAPNAPIVAAAINRLRGQGARSYALVMPYTREPRIHTVPIDELRPTQITVGMREVAEKREHWRAESGGAKADFLGQHMIPVVLGPRGRPYVVDHHHLALALHQEKVAEVAVTVFSDLSKLERDAFWVYMDNRSWCHLYDADGKRRDHDALPKTVAGLVDDPYRSLAGALRRAGGFAKDTTPFSEFLWADFLRRRVKRKHATSHPEIALAEALRLARTSEADYLPGWSGPCD